MKFIAEQQLESNIAEYIIYMYQVEDVIRAYKMDIDLIRKNIIQPQIKSEAFEKEEVKWYAEIIEEMKSRHIEARGHIYRLGEVITELIYLHNTLKDVVKDKKYLALIEAAKESVQAFQKRSDSEKNHFIEVCLQALYMKLLLRLQKKEISGASEAAFDLMRIVLAYLAEAYHQMKSGNMELFEPQGD